MMRVPHTVVSGAAIASPDPGRFGPKYSRHRAPASSSALYNGPTGPKSRNINADIKNINVVLTNINVHLKIALSSVEIVTLPCGIDQTPDLRSTCA
jgi:hypothetical protein